MNSDLVEEVARDMWWETHTMPWYAANDSDKSRMMRQARAAIAVLRPVLRAEALEEAAKECDRVSTDVLTKVGREHEPYMRATAEDCAAAIRAMIPKETA